MTTPERLKLRHGAASAEIAVLGAEARVWRIDDRELLWASDPGVWDQISPLLFPVVGWTRDGARIDGRHYALGLHGFAAAQNFTVEAHSQSAARLTLRENRETLAVYPFAFRLTVDYRLHENALEIVFEVENKNAAPTPYACGLHPGFCWPFADGRRQDYEIHFERPEKPEVPVIAPGGLISPRKRPIPIEGTVLKLSDELFAHDALCFIDPASRALRFVAPSGASIAMTLEGFQHFALWKRGDAPFLCLEAWTGYSDPEGFAGELRDKPGMRVLAPGEIARHRATYSFTPAPGKSS